MTELLTVRAAAERLGVAFDLAMDLHCASTTRHRRYPAFRIEVRALQPRKACAAVPSAAWEDRLWCHRPQSTARHRPLSPQRRPALRCAFGVAISCDRVITRDAVNELKLKRGMSRAIASPRGRRRLDDRPSRRGGSKFADVRLAIGCDHWCVGLRRVPPRSHLPSAPAAPAQAAPPPQLPARHPLACDQPRDRHVRADVVPVQSTAPLFRERSYDPDRG